MDSSGKQGPKTRSQSQSRTPSLLPEGTATAPTVDTPPHRTDKPWTEVAKGASTPRAAALAPPSPDHPYESANQFTSLRQTEDDGSDDGSHRSGEVLLTPGDLTLPPVEESVDVGVPAGAADAMHGDVTVPGPAAAAPAISYSDLNAIVQATAIGLNKLQQVMEGLTNNVQTTSSQIASLSTALTETKETAERAFRQASAANVAPDPFRSSTRRTPTVLIKLAPACSMLSRPQKTCSFLDPTSPMPLLKPHHRNKVSLSDQTEPFTTGGLITNSDPQFPMAMLSPSSRQCRATLNPHGYGRNTPTPSCKTLVSRLPPTNPVCIRVLSPVDALSSNARLTTLQSPRPTNGPLTFS